VPWKKHSFVVGPNGHLFKCELGIHDIREAVGVLAEPTITTKMKKRLPVVSTGSKAHAWEAFNPFDRELCSTCQFVPICKSGCPKKVMEGSEQFMSGTCEYWDTNFVQMVHEAYAGSK